MKNRFSILEYLNVSCMGFIVSKDNMTTLCNVLPSLPLPHFPLIPPPSPPPLSPLVFPYSSPSSLHSLLPLSAPPLPSSTIALRVPVNREQLQGKSIADCIVRATVAVRASLFCKCEFGQLHGIERKPLYGLCHNCKRLSA